MRITVLKVSRPPEMIEPGAAESLDYVLSDVGPDLRKELAAAVYEAMEATKAKRLADNL